MAHQTLERIAPELRRLQPQLLAVHYQGAAQHEAALDLWERAGQICVEHSSHVEAVFYQERALEQLRSLPPSDLRELS